MKRKNFTADARHFLCSEHFSEDQIDRTYASGLRLKDRSTAMPTIFKSLPPYFQPPKTKVSIIYILIGE